MQPYRRAQRLYTEMIDAVFPIDLSAYAADIAAQGGEFKSLSIEAVGVKYHRGKMRDHQLPRDMRGFTKVALKEEIGGLAPKGEADVVYLIAGTCIDAEARLIAGMASDLRLALRYDRKQAEVDGEILVLHGPGVAPEGGSPVAGIALSFCFQYFPPD